jgi:hypothetical protein
MLSLRTHRPAGWLVLGAVCALAPTASGAVSAVRLSGTLAGHVRDAGGVPQMGAAVIVYNRLDRAFQKVFTNANGEFAFTALMPDTYSVRVTLNTFAPAFKQNILVQPGMRSVLNVKLANLFSTIQFSYPSIENGSIMTDEWKWVMRSASSARPVLRFVNGQTDPANLQTQAAMFSDTRGILKVSAGDGGIANGTSKEADMGTAFALATSLYGNNNLQVSGNLGYGSQSGAPSASFRTSYSRNLAGGSPEVSLTMRQLFLPARLAAAIGGNQDALPMLRTMSAGFEDRTEVADGVLLQYGITLDSVQFVDRLNYFSPYARLSYSGDAGEIEFAYTSGNARPDLAGSQSPDAELQHDLNTLGLFPNVTLRDGRARVQRGQEYEFTYSRKVGSRSYSLSAYHEQIANMALPLLAPAGLYSEGDLLPDLFSGSSVFNAGDHQSAGYVAGLTQALGEHVNATIFYSSGGALTAEGRELVSGSPDELRSMIRWGRRQAATVRIAATSRWTGTHLIASYQWANDHSAAIASNLYSTRGVRPAPGLNLYIRQPLPGGSILPWKMEATADLRNMLAQGYLPFMMSNGQRVTAVEWPRTIRGGLSFIF